MNEQNGGRVNTQGLTPSQLKIADALHRLLGSVIADRYVDFCKLANGQTGLFATRSLAGHALRELETLLRTVMAAPLDAVAEDDERGEARRSEAVTALKRMGYEPETLQDVQKALRPKFTHRAQILRILDRLGFSAESDTAKAWIALSKSTGEVHKRRFDHSLAVDDDFRERFMRPFDALLADLMGALELRYGKLIARAEKIAAMPPEQGLSAFVDEIPTAPQLQQRFYASLAAENWLPALKKRGLLRPPAVDIERDPDGYRQWPVGNYLLRMAGSENDLTRAQVMEVIRSLAPSRHPDVVFSSMEIIAVLPPKDAAAVADVVAGWLNPQTAFPMQLPSEIITKLADAGEVEAALPIAEAFFQVFWREGRLATLFGHLMYEHFLPQSTEVLAKAAPLRATALFCRLLHETARLKGYLEQSGQEDRTQYLVNDLDGNRADSDVPTALAHALVASASEAIRQTPTDAAAVVKTIMDPGGRLFERIAMLVVAGIPEVAPEWAAAFLLDETKIGQEWCAKEYGRLANAWFAKLSTADQQRILHRIDGMPDAHREIWLNYFRRQFGRDPSPAEEREYRFGVVRDAVWDWRDVLPAERRHDMEVGIADFGGRDDWKNKYLRQVASPLPRSRMDVANIKATTVFLRKWSKREGYEEAAETDALAEALRSAVTEDPGAYAERAELFNALPDVFLRVYLEALRSPAASGAVKSWSGLLGLLSAAVRHGRMQLEVGRGEHDPHFRVLKAATELMSSAIRSDKVDAESATSERLHRLCIELISISDLAREPEQKGDFDGRAYFRAKNTLRGSSLELAILLLYRDRVQRPAVGTSSGRAERETDILRLLHEALNETGTQAVHVRAIVGRYLGVLHRCATEWTSTHMASIFPPGDDYETLRDAAWSSHLLDGSGAVPELVADMKNLYVREISEFGSSDRTEAKHRSGRLTDYIIWLHVADKLPEDILVAFLESRFAPKQHAMLLIGRIIGAPLADETAAVRRARAKSYWARRFSAAQEKGAERADFASEIGSIGQWFLWNVDDDWLIGQLTAATRAGYAPNDVYTVLNRLSELRGDLVEQSLELLLALARSPQVGRLSILVQTTAVRQILSNGSASGAESKVADIAHSLAAKGDPSYLELLNA